MNPLIKKWLDAENAVSKARKLADKALAKANTLKAPKNLRPATAKDIRAGIIIWYPGDKQKYSDEDFWKLIKEVLYPNDDWKAFLAHDGCRYGLRNAYVEKIERMRNDYQGNM